LEIELEKANIPFQKFGGMKFIETSHIKDLIAYARILFNPKDAISWQRVLLLMEGIGPAKAEKVIEGITDNSLTLDNYNKLDLGKHNEPIKNLFKILHDLKKSKASIGDKTALLAEYYRPILKSRFDDWQKRWKDIETFMTIAERYDSISSFLNDMAIDPPLESVSELTPESKDDEILTLSTIHSAKGLEWKVVFLIWALEGKFPSAKASDNLDSVEEERRLFYVACTRAKDYLYITHPTNIFDRESGFVLSQPSRFIADIDESLLDRYIIAEE
jgi:DNA helicase-2/ATP-dependent DNA helicase PcrA